MHSPSHIFQYPKVTPVAPQGASDAKPANGAPPVPSADASTAGRPPQR